jgi:hypothetical protein
VTEYLPPNFIKVLSDASIELEIVVELELDGGTITISETSVHGLPILKSVSSLLHKLQPAYGKSNIGKHTVKLIDEDEWGPIVADNYIKNRRFNAKVGPRGAADASFYTYFTGLIVNFDVKNGVLVLDVQDDLYIAKEKVPEENDTNTQTLAYQNQNPIAIKTNLIETQGGVPSARIDSDAFDFEEANNFPGWYFDRVLTRPTAIKTLINELDEQTLNMVFADGDKITTKTFGPPPPGTDLLELEDGHIRGSLAYDGAMDEHFVNRCVVYYDYDESGSEGEENYDNLAVAVDAESQDSDHWDEVATKTIKSKWIRSYTIAQPTNITGVVIYHCNPQNGAGTGALAYNSANDTLTWTAPGDSAGSAVDIGKDGRFQIFSNDTTKYVRVVVTYASLPGGNQSDNLSITVLPGAQLAGLLASHWVARYADPQAEINFNLDMSAAVFLDKFIRVSDIIKITSGRIFTKRRAGWDQERIMLSSVKPDFEKKRFKVEGIQTSFKKRYGFISPSAHTDDYDDADENAREYAFVGTTADNEVGTDAEDGYYIW